MDVLTVILGVYKCVKEAVILFSLLAFIKLAAVMTIFMVNLLQILVSLGI